MLNLEITLNCIYYLFHQARNKRPSLSKIVVKFEKKLQKKIANKNTLLTYVLDVFSGDE